MSLSITNTFVKLAVREAEKSDMKIKHGSTLVSNGRVISRGYNHTRTTISGKGKRMRLPKSLCQSGMVTGGLPMCSVHAEVHCLLNTATDGSYFKPRPLFEPQIS